MRETFAKNKVLFIVALILLFTNLFLLFFVAFKKPEESPRNTAGRSVTGRGEVMQLLQKEVGFDSVQLERYKKMKEEHWDIMRPYFGEIRTAKDNFYKLLGQSSIPDSVVNAMADSIGAKQKQLDLQTFRHFQQVRALCTPEQQPRFDSVVQQVMKKMNGPWRRGGSKEDSTRKEHEHSK